jgi:acyl-CoA thioesterase-1
MEPAARRPLFGRRRGRLLLGALLLLGPALCLRGGEPAQPDRETPVLSRTRERLLAQKPVTLVLYGDSISEVGRSPRWHGGAASPETNWGAVLAGLIGAAHPGSEVTPVHFSIGGQNSYEGLGRLDWLPAESPDLVLVAFGTNDLWWHELQPAATERALRELVEQLQKRHGADVVLVSTAGENPSQERYRHTEETIAATRRAAEATGVPFVNMREAILAATGNGERWGEYHLKPDNAHPNDKGHRVWAETVFAVLRPHLAPAE